MTASTFFFKLFVVEETFLLIVVLYLSIALLAMSSYCRFWLAFNRVVLDEPRRFFVFFFTLFKPALIPGETFDFIAFAYTFVFFFCRAALVSFSLTFFTFPVLFLIPFAKPLPMNLPSFSVIFDGE